MTHTLGGTPLEQGSGRRRDPFFTTDNIHNRHPFPPAVFKPAVPASERPQTHTTPTPLYTNGEGAAVTFVKNPRALNVNLNVSSVCSRH